MSAPLPRWSDTLLRVGLLGVAGVVFGIPIGLMAWVRTPLATGEQEWVDQPIEFDHRHHVRDDGIGCRYCHFDAWRGPSAGIPSTDVCMNCHVQIWNDSPKLEPVLRSWYDDEQIAWRRVHDLPDFVYFDHQAHVTRGVGCEECHGRVDLMVRVRQDSSLNMGWCLSCHRDPAPRLRPPRDVAVMGYDPERPRAELGAELIEAMNIQPPLDCSGCHR